MLWLELDKRTKNGSNQGKSKFTEQRNLHPLSPHFSHFDCPKQQKKKCHVTVLLSVRQSQKNSNLSTGLTKGCWPNGPVPRQGCGPLIGFKAADAFLPSPNSAIRGPNPTATQPTPASLYRAVELVAACVGAAVAAALGCPGAGPGAGAVDVGSSSEVGPGVADGANGSAGLAAPVAEMRTSVQPHTNYLCCPQNFF